MTPKSRLASLFAGTILTAALAAGASSASAAPGSTLGGPLVLRDDGSFFIGGQKLHTEYPNVNNTGLFSPGTYVVNQMYVHYRIPLAAGNRLPVIMVHGSNHTGVTYETTPDGREGWATYFLRKGYPVYVIDHAGRGRSGFDPTVVHRARATNDASILPAFPLYPIQGAWVNFLFGPEFGVTWPGQQFPMEALDDYQKQLVPNTESTLTGGGTNTVNALVELVDRIGPSIVIVHSQSGSYGLNLIRQRPNLVKAFLDVEGNCGPLSDADMAQFTQVPFLALWGDYSEGAVGANGDARRNGCINAVNQINAAGGNAEFMLLPAMGIPGNSHMLMMDKNNLQLADIMIDWIRKNGRN